MLEGEAIWQRFPGDTQNVILRWKDNGSFVTSLKACLITMFNC